MPFELRNSTVPLMLLYDVNNMLKYAFELLAFSYGIFRPVYNKMNCHISQSFFDISSRNLT